MEKRIKKQRTKSRKKSGSSIVTVEDDDAEGTKEKAAVPKQKEIEIQFAQEAAQEAAVGAAEIMEEFKTSKAVLGFLAG